MGDCPTNFVQSKLLASEALGLANPVHRLCSASEASARCGSRRTLRLGHAPQSASPYRDEQSPGENESADRLESPTCSKRVASETMWF